MRIKLQKTQADMLRIKRNPLEYSVVEYNERAQDNFNTLEDSKKKFAGYRNKVQSRVQEMEEKHIRIEELSAVDTEKLHDLQEIDKYLARAIDEYQRILSLQLDLQVLYEEELKNVSEMSLVQRFNLHTDFRAY